MFGYFVCWGFHIVDYRSDWYIGFCVVFVVLLKLVGMIFVVLGILSFSCL